MRFILVVIAVLYIACGFFAQIDNGIESIKSQDSCYFRYNEKGEKLTNSRIYGEWQCGKTAGIIDCNKRSGQMASQLGFLITYLFKSLISLGFQGFPCAIKS